LDDIGGDKGGNSACGAGVKDGTSWVVNHIGVVIVVVVVVRRVVA